MKIIAFCGVDGAGKSTQIQQVKYELEKNGKKVFVSKVNYYPFHRYLNHEVTQYEIRINMAFTFVQHYLELVEELSGKAYDFLLCDRYSLCHLAFVMTYGVENEKIKKLIAIYNIAYKPDLILYFDIPLNVSIKRIYARLEKEADTDETPEILGETIKNYEKLIMEDIFDKVVRIDATLSKEQQTNQIMKTIMESDE